MTLVGGLAASTISVLTILPLTFAIVQRRACREPASLHPDDVGARVAEGL